MTFMEVAEIIKETAEKHGFSTEGDISKGFPHIVQKRGDVARLLVCVPIDYEEYDKESGIAVYKPEIRTAVLHMGGEKTPEELLEMTQQIRRVAELAQELRGMDLSYMVQRRG